MLKALLKSLTAITRVLVTNPIRTVGSFSGMLFKMAVFTLKPGKWDGKTTYKSIWNEHYKPMDWSDPFNLKKEDTIKMEDHQHMTPAEAEKIKEAMKVKELNKKLEYMHKHTRVNKPIARKTNITMKVGM